MATARKLSDTASWLIFSAFFIVGLTVIVIGAVHRDAATMTMGSGLISMGLTMLALGRRLPTSNA
jgi:hypothetical protein